MHTGNFVFLLYGLSIVCSQQSRDVNSVSYNPRPYDRPPSDSEGAIYQKTVNGVSFKIVAMCQNFNTVFKPGLMEFDTLQGGCRFVVTFDKTLQSSPTLYTPRSPPRSKPPSPPNRTIYRSQAAERAEPVYPPRPNNKNQPPPSANLYNKPPSREPYRPAQPSQYPLPSRRYTGTPTDQSMGPQAPPSQYPQPQPAAPSQFPQRSQSGQFPRRIDAPSIQQRPQAPPSQFPQRNVHQYYSKQQTRPGPVQNRQPMGVPPQPPGSVRGPYPPVPAAPVHQHGQAPPPAAAQQLNRQQLEALGFATLHGPPVTKPPSNAPIPRV